MSSPGMPEHTAAASVSAISALYRDCPARFLLDQLADKWTILIVAVLDHGPVRFNELRRRVDGITQRVLTQCLRQLERNGLVRRTVATTGPLSVTYDLTELGASLHAPMSALYEWTSHNLASVAAAQRQFDALA